MQDHELLDNTCRRAYSGRMHENECKPRNLSPHICIITNPLSQNKAKQEHKITIIKLKHIQKPF